MVNYIYNIYLKKKFTKNGNPVFNVKIIESDKIQNKNNEITQQFFKDFDFKNEKINYLKNGTVNIFQYKSILENKIEHEILRYSIKNLFPFFFASHHPCCIMQRSIINIIFHIDLGLPFY